MENTILNIPTKNSIKSILELLNPFLGNLTPQELMLLDIMISNKWIIINSDNRAAIRDKSNLKKFTFNNYIKKLKDKNAIVTKDKVSIVNPRIVQITKNKTLTITFNEL